MNRPLRAPVAGFTLLEMSVVLVIIALIIGAVSVGRDVYRNAVAERISTEFVQAWMIAYDRYVAQTGVVPGDNLANPSGRVRNGSVDPLCDTTASKDLRNAMLERGIALPPGRAEGMESRYAYQDSNGVPQELQICFTSVTDWAEPGPGDTYVPRVRNVMILRGMTPELANQLDSRIDSRIDARFGRLRENTRYNSTAAVGSPPTPNPWSKDGLARRQSGNDDAQVDVVTGYMKMNQ